MKLPGEHPVELSWRTPSLILSITLTFWKLVKESTASYWGNQKPLCVLQNLSEGLLQACRKWFFSLGLTWEEPWKASSQRKFRGEGDVPGEADGAELMTLQTGKSRAPWDLSFSAFSACNKKPFPICGVHGGRYCCLRTLCKCQTHYQAEEGRVLIELFLQPSALHNYSRIACVIMAFLQGPEWKRQIICKEMSRKE